MDENQEAQKHDHKAVITFNDEQLQLSRRVYALQEAVKLINSKLAFVSNMSYVKDKNYQPPATSELIAIVENVAVEFETYLITGEVTL